MLFGLVNNRFKLMPVLPYNRKTVWILLVVFVVSYAVLVAFYYSKTQAYALEEAQKMALDALVSHKAVHRYVAEVQRPEIYRLKEEGALYQGYFSPKVMSFTYIARSVKELLNAEREKVGLPPIYFKLAADNPRNPINQADAFEVALLKRMNSGEVHEIREVVEKDGVSLLHVALPVDRSSVGCLKCHGDPQDAPAELISQYGNERGFYEEPDSIRALISIRIPLAATMQTANQVAGLLSIISLLVMTAIYGLVHFFVLRADRYQCAANDNAAALKDAKDYAENLIRTANVLMVELDASGYVRELNPAAEKITGYTREELIGCDWFETVVPRERYPEVWKVFETFMAQGAPQYYENSIFTKGGEERYIIWQNSSLLLRGQPTGTLSFGIDMTEQRKITQSLATKDWLLENAQHIAHLGTWRLNHADGTLAWSEEMFALAEVPVTNAPLSQDTWLELIHPADRERVSRALGYSIQHCGHYDMTYRLQFADGLEKYVHEHSETRCDNHGKAAMTIGVVQDVTEQVLNEQAIKESELRFRTIADYTFDWEYWQGTQGEILYINSACQRISGYTQAEFIANPTLLESIVHPDDRQAYKDHHHDAFQT